MRKIQIYFLPSKSAFCGYTSIITHFLYNLNTKSDGKIVFLCIISYFITFAGCLLQGKYMWYPFQGERLLNKTTLRFYSRAAWQSMLLLGVDITSHIRFSRVDMRHQVLHVSVKTERIKTWNGQKSQNGEKNFLLKHLERKSVYKTGSKKCWAFQSLSLRVSPGLCIIQCIAFLACCVSGILSTLVQLRYPLWKDNEVS